MKIKELEKVIKFYKKEKIKDIYFSPDNGITFKEKIGIAETYNGTFFIYGYGKTRDDKK